MKGKVSLTLKEYKESTAILSALTESERRLDNYLQEHFNEIPYHGIVDVSGNAAVSKATIGRFLNKMGFTGYAAFRRVVEATLSEQKMISPYTLATRPQTRPRRATEEIVAEFNHNVSHLFEHFKGNVDLKSLDQFIDIILDNERKLFVVGPSSSHAMATHFVTLVQYFRDRVTLLNLNAGEVPKALMNLGENDVLIVFSYYRFNNMALRIAELFRDKKATVVLITNSGSNPYGKFCNLQFVLPSDTHSVFKSRIIGFFFIELSLHLAYEKSEGEGNFEQLEALFTFFDTFSSGT
ncbi:MurR/RpiR family transcriptional regulator [Enterobacter sp. Cy-643]|uniref:MurR/RpiR family transcriptional regulator n=1 Tax=Enterobacter sp. Cy-643 TaxID=2608346 RepID=UPI001423820A|nr:MurR/RpiR family transcriptional regulator [Enterobacter sp. Cy-643]NIF32387.1 MurR/RpiR family transcriptional regulator [Enterobacter sp. Cy-643]